MIDGLNNMVKSRKELTKEYKQKAPRIGVFQVRNTKSGKIFIGASTALDTIWNSIRFRLDAKSYINTGLQNDWATYGADAFQFEVLHELKIEEGSAIDVREELRELEKLTIEDMQPFGDRGYN